MLLSELPPFGHHQECEMCGEKRYHIDISDSWPIQWKIYQRLCPDRSTMSCTIFGCLEVSCRRCGYIVREMTLKEEEHIKRYGNIEDELASITTALNDI